MEEQLHHLLLSEAAAAALDTRIQAAERDLKAAKAEADREGIERCTAIYDDLVAAKEVVDTRRAALEAQLAGGSPPLPAARLPYPGCLTHLVCCFCRVSFLQSTSQVLSKCRCVGLGMHVHKRAGDVGLKAARPAVQHFASHWCSCATDHSDRTVCRGGLPVGVSVIL